jgi:hypothetical protein
VWPFTILFSRSSKRHSSDEATSPDKTALMSFEELSSYDDDDSDSSGSVPSFSLLDQFPIWKEIANHIDDDDKLSVENHRNGTKDTFPEPSTPIKSSSSSNQKAKEEHQPFARLLTPKTRNGKDRCRSDDVSTNNNGDADSVHFSISTDFHNSVYSWRPQEVPSSKTFDSCFSPSSSTSWDLEECEHLSRVTLQKFMESTVNDLTATSAMKGGTLMMNQKNLSNITSNDNISFGSTFLAVSYDEQYPQLVLQPSLDDGTAAESIRDSVGKSSSSTLGVNFAHPAAEAGARRASDSCTRHLTPIDQQIPSYTAEWMKDSIENEWKQIDFDLSNEGSFYEMMSTTSTAAPSFGDPSSLNWIIEGALEWSQSARDGVKSITEMIEKEVVQPIIKNLVDTPPPMPVPNKKVGTSRLRLVPQDRRPKRKKQACRSTESAKQCLSRKSNLA